MQLESAACNKSVNRAAIFNSVAILNLTELSDLLSTFSFSRNTGRKVSFIKWLFMKLQIFYSKIKRLRRTFPLVRNKLCCFLTCNCTILCYVTAINNPARTTAQNVIHLLVKSLGSNPCQICCISKRGKVLASNMTHKQRSRIKCLIVFYI